MPLIRSIKHQSLLVFIAFGLVLGALYATLAIVAAFIVEDEVIARLLQGEARYVEQYYAAEQTLPPPRLDFVQLFSDHNNLPRFVQQALEHPSQDQEIFTAGDTHYHYRTLTLGTSQTGYLLAEVSPLLIVSSTPRLFGFFFFGLLLSLVIGTVLALKLAALTVRPVLEMTEAIKSRQALPSLRYELGFLAQTLQQALDELGNSLQREKDFTADVNHELRTPLTILKNTITLAEQRGMQKADYTQLRGAAQQMQHTIDILLALARAETIPQQPCRLKTQLEQLAMQCSSAQGREADLDIDIADDYIVRANPVLLDLLLTNLINNAITHGGDTTLRVRAQNGDLVFTNSRKHRVTESIDTNITAAGVKGPDSNGEGQGLYLVTRILASLGWQHRIEYQDRSFSVIISP